MTTTPPRGCSNISDDYYLLCNVEMAWGIVLESLAAAGVLITIFLICSLFFLICKVQDNSKRQMISIYFFFLLGTLGVFGLTFAFIIKLNDTTRPTRFFLFGVIFALCFACLLTHACNLSKLVRGRKPFSWLVLLLLIFSFLLVQVVINIEYLVTMLVNQRDTFLSMSREDTNKDFVMLLIYVLFLMALTFLVSMFTFCGPYKSWKRHGAHIFVTALFSIAIWVVWITMLTKGNTVLERPSWDDPVMAIALVSNGWIFLIMYIVPEICFLTAPLRLEDYPPENNFCQPKLIKQTTGVDNRAYTQDELVQGGTENLSYSPYSSHFQMKTIESQSDFSIPRPKARTSPYHDYTGGKGPM
ncbi:retinoic acid-induced protein 3-like isoform X1 [Indicator indicator]|uniref:retinoic acid-induced protein 3-like isoform X1 n=1 Tax=Indicator indicator TaxID=1002788 RepID=UPI0023DFB4D0|nr:retinoic acid-induced protein 3-like isoform X1 [Indicator indicator]